MILNRIEGYDSRRRRRHRPAGRAAAAARARLLLAGAARGRHLRGRGARGRGAARGAQPRARRRRDAGARRGRPRPRVRVHRPRRPHRALELGRGAGAGPAHRGLFRRAVPGLHRGADLARRARAPRPRRRPRGARGGGRRHGRRGAAGGAREVSPLQPGPVLPGRPRPRRDDSRGSFGPWEQLPQTYLLAADGTVIYRAEGFSAGEAEIMAGKVERAFCSRGGRSPRRAPTEPRRRRRPSRRRPRASASGRSRTSATARPSSRATRRSWPGSSTAPCRTTWRRSRRSRRTCTPSCARRRSTSAAANPAGPSSTGSACSPCGRTTPRPRAASGSCGTPLRPRRGRPGRLTARVPWSITKPSRRVVHNQQGGLAWECSNGSAVLLLPVLLSGALPARAQAPPAKEPPRFFGIFATTVGGWSEYAVTETEGGKKSTMRNAIVGKEGDAFWYEVAITEGGRAQHHQDVPQGRPEQPGEHPAADHEERRPARAGDAPRIRGDGPAHGDVDVRDPQRLLGREPAEPQGRGGRAPSR